MSSNIRAKRVVVDGHVFHLEHFSLTDEWHVTWEDPPGDVDGELGMVIRDPKRLDVPNAYSYAVSEMREFEKHRALLQRVTDEAGLDVRYF